MLFRVTKGMSRKGKEQPAVAVTLTDMRRYEKVFAAGPAFFFGARVAFD